MRKVGVAEREDVWAVKINDGEIEEEEIPEG